MNRQPSLFDDVPAFADELIARLQSLKVQTDTPLKGWWTQHNETLDAAIREVRAAAKAKAGQTARCDLELPAR
jgi:hypothetical protein